jgi:hypothetical protein
LSSEANPGVRAPAWLADLAGGERVEYNDPRARIVGYMRRRYGDRPN